MIQAERQPKSIISMTMNKIPQRDTAKRGTTNLIIYREILYLQTDKI